MRLNAEINTVLYHKLKSKLALKGLSIKAWVEAMVKKELGK